MTRSALAPAAVLVIAGAALTGCAAANATSCARGVDSAKAAVAGLIDAARSASAPADVCPWIESGMSVSQAQLDALTRAFAEEPDAGLTIRVGDQMGSTVPVEVTSRDGAVSMTFDGFSDSHGRWTVAYGTLAEVGDGGPSSDPAPPGSRTPTAASTR